MTLRIWVTWIGMLALAGCGKDIGDSCKSVNECISTDIDRLCLTQDGEGFPGGYCTKFNCGGSNACPEEATCVAYRSTLGGGGCDSDTTISRLQRNYCMLRCGQDSDCRAGYRCLEADGNNPLGALIIDGHVGAKICTLSYDEPQSSPDRESEVCVPTGLRGSNADAGSVMSDAANEAPTSDSLSEAPTSDATSEAPTSEAPTSDAMSEAPTSEVTSEALTSEVPTSDAEALTSSTDPIDGTTSENGQTTDAPLSTLESLAPDAALSPDASAPDASGL